MAKSKHKQSGKLSSAASENLSKLYQAALAQQAKGDFEGATRSYKKILQQKPDSIESLCNLGGILHARGNLVEAIKYYQRALEVKPDIPQLYFNLAGALQSLGQTANAKTNYTRALAIKPDYAEAACSLGMLEMQAGAHNDALAHLKHALSISPNNPDICNCIGICLKSSGDTLEAMKFFQHALDINPNHFEALGNIATELLSRGEFEQSIEANRRALTLRPNEPKLLYNMGVAYKERKSFQDATDCFRKALTIEPSAPHTRLELAYTLQAVCDWSEEQFSIHSAALLTREILDSGDDTDIDLFKSLSLPLDNETLLRIAQRNSKAIEERSRQYDVPPIFNRDIGNKRLRVGYLSPKYRNHPGAHLMNGLFNAHDRGNFEIFAYSTGPNDGSIYRHRAEADAEHFIDLYNEPVSRCIEKIRSDDIQILVDFAGYTTGARPEIFAARSAPIQINFLGFPGSLGAEFFDYLVTDTIVTPDSYQKHFTENFAYLPHCYQINDARNVAAEDVPSRTEVGLPEDAFVFCCFNNNYKIDSGIFQTWADIMQQVPGSVIWLLRGSDLQTENLRREATRHGLNPKRIIFAEPVDKAAHLARHCHADLFLDTLYYNAHTTGSDALRQGVPMITCQGDTFASRVGSSLLHAVGLDELVTTSLDQYVQKAITLGTDPSAMKHIRRKLSDNLPRSSLLDNPRFANSLERLYKIMWRRFANGEKPGQIPPNHTTPPGLEHTSPPDP